MTTTEPSEPTAVPAAENPARTKAEPKSAANAKASTDTNKPDLVTLDALAREVKISPRDARMLLRLAAKQTKLYPTLGKAHVARQPWQWAAGSKALEEARRALTATAEA